MEYFWDTGHNTLDNNRVAPNSRHYIFLLETIHTNFKEKEPIKYQLIVSASDLWIILKSEGETPYHLRKARVKFEGSS